MASPRLISLPAPLGVFVGGMLGGGARIGIDALFSPVEPGLPLDIVLINIVGAFLLGLISSWVVRHGPRLWVPAVGTGALGAFTTFSALAALPWATSAPLALTLTLVLATLAGSIGAAALGWHLEKRLTRGRTGGRQ